MSWLALDWFAAETGEAAGHFGFFVGTASGTLADILIIGLIASSPRLGIGRFRPEQKWTSLRVGLQRAGYCIPAISVLSWLWLEHRTGWQHGAYVQYYAKMVAYGCVLPVAVIVLLGMLTAANQIGARSVR